MRRAPSRFRRRRRPASGHRCPRDVRSTGVDIRSIRLDIRSYSSGHPLVSRPDGSPWGAAAARRHDSGVTRMYGDAGTLPARSWSDLFAPAARRAARGATTSGDPVSGGARSGLPTVVAIGAAITLLVSVAPFIHFGYRSAETHVFIDAVASVIALLGAVLLAERFRRSGLAGDLLLLAALAVLAAANLLLSVVPALATTGETALSTWALLIARLFGTALLAAAALAPRVRLRGPRRAAVATLGACAAALALLAAGAVLIGDGLPAAVTPALPPASHPGVVGQPLLLVGQLAGMALFAA